MDDILSETIGISVGDSLPKMDFKIMGEDGPDSLSYADLFEGKKVVLFALPGAFTRTCTATHLPGYLENLETLKSKGVDEVAVLSVNDVFVMDAWAKSTNGVGKIHFLADGALEFTKAIGADIDLGIAGFGIRSKRLSMIVDDGVVKSLNIEESPGTAITSGVATILEQL